MAWTAGPPMPPPMNMNGPPAVPPTVAERMDLRYQGSRCAATRAGSLRRCSGVRTFFTRGATLISSSTDASRVFLYSAYAWSWL